MFTHDNKLITQPWRVYIESGCRDAIPPSLLCSVFYFETSTRSCIFLCGRLTPVSAAERRNVRITTPASCGVCNHTAAPNCAHSCRTSFKSRERLLLVFSVMKAVSAKMSVSHVSLAPEHQHALPGSLRGHTGQQRSLNWETLQRSESACSCSSHTLKSLRSAQHFTHVPKNLKSMLRCFSSEEIWARGRVAMINLF